MERQLAIGLDPIFSLSQGPTKTSATLITDIPRRRANSTSLNGSWEYIVDPYETGFYDYRYKELNENNGRPIGIVIFPPVKQIWSSSGIIQNTAWRFRVIGITRNQNSYIMKVLSGTKNPSIP